MKASDSLITKPSPISKSNQLFIAGPPLHPLSLPATSLWFCKTYQKTAARRLTKTLGSQYTVPVSHQHPVPQYLC